MSMQSRVAPVDERVRPNAMPSVCDHPTIRPTFYHTHCLTAFAISLPSSGALSGCQAVRLSGDAIAPSIPSTIGQRCQVVRLSAVTGTCTPTANYLPNIQTRRRRKSRSRVGARLRVGGGRGACGEGLTPTGRARLSSGRRVASTARNVNLSGTRFCRVGHSVALRVIL